MKKPSFPHWLYLLAIAIAPLDALAHIEYFDLNQGAHVTNLTAAGKTASTTQYGQTPANVLALNGPPRADGIAAIGISAQQASPLNNASLWNATNQVTTAVGTFTGLTYTAASSTAAVDVNDVTDNAWADGLRSVLGDSHRVDFFNFRLSQTSNVVITWNVDSAGTYIDCALSLYAGVLPYQGHDDAAEILNPFKVGTGKVQDVLDTGAYADAQGNLSVLRNTGPGAPTYVGQFNAVANWSQANPDGNWGVLAYLTSVNAKTTSLSATASDTSESLSIQLPPGNYTIAASGALGAPGSGASFGLTNLHGRLTYVATAAISDSDGDGIANNLDNCPVTPNASQANSDADARGNACDNCTLVANATQTDSDNDGYGNLCDGDLNNSNLTTSSDFNLMRTVLNQSSGANALAAAADMNVSGLVTSADFTLLRARINTAPGPSGLGCAGTIPCPSP